MNAESIKLSLPSYSSYLVAVSLLSAVLFNGEHIYFLSLCWQTFILFAVYRFYKSGVATIPLDVVLLLSVIYLAWLMLSLYWHPVAWQGVYFNWRLSILIFAMVVAYVLFGKNEIRDVLQGVIIVALVDAIWTLYQSIYLGHSADGFFINKNNNAAFLNLLLLPVAAQLLFSSRKLTNDWLFSCLFSLIFLCVLVISSRGAFVGLFVAATILVALALYEKRWRNLIFLSILAVLTLGIFTLISDVAIKTTFGSHSRWSMWFSTLTMITESGWQGIGNGMFSLRYPQYRQADDMSGGMFVHNDYLQMLLELGMPGVFLFLLILLLVFVRVRWLLSKSSNMGDVAVYLGMAAAILAVAVHSLVTFNYYKASILLVLGLYFGMIFGRTSEASQFCGKTYTVIATNRNVAALLFLLLTLTSPLFLIGYADAVADGFIGDELANSPPQRKYQIYQQLWKLDPNNYVYPFFMASSYDDSVDGGDQQQRTAEFVKRSELFKQAEKLNPYASVLYIHEAEFIAQYKDVAGDDWPENAVPLALKALSLNPLQYQLRMRVAKLLDAAGRKYDALGVMLEGLARNNECDMAFYEYGQTLGDDLKNRYAIKRFARLIELEKAKNDKLREEFLNKYRVRANVS